MDVVLLDKNSIKIKGKNSSFVVDPASKMPKVSADAVLLLEDDREGLDATRVDDYRILLKGQGEYEVGGIKISGQKSDNSFIYSLDVDSLGILLGRTSALNKSHQEAKDYKVLILNVDSDIDQALITSFEARLIILYGEGADKKSGKTLGKGEVESVKKISVTNEKLPAEMQVIILG